MDPTLTEREMLLGVILGLTVSHRPLPIKLMDPLAFENLGVNNI